MAPPKPSLDRALLVCDMVIEDKTTNKKSLVGLFTHIWAMAFPFAHHKMGVYFCLTDAEGTYEILLRLVNSESESENLIAEAGVTVQINDMLGINDFGINLPAVRFPGRGGMSFSSSRTTNFSAGKSFASPCMRRILLVS